MRLFGCPHLFGSLQPFGSPTDIVDDELLGARRLVDGVARRLMHTVIDALERGAEFQGALHAVSRTTIDPTDLAEALYRAGLKGAMLGADDAEFEAEEDAVVTPDRFESLRLRRADKRDQFRGRPMNEAVEAFRKRKAVTRDVFDQMDAKQRSESFTVAGLETARAVEAVQDELAKALTDGNFGQGRSESDLRAFRRRLRERLDAGGFLTPDVQRIGELKPSHVETVFRNGVMSAYADGRRAQMTQPHVMAARPFWQVMTVNDGPPRQRPTHRAVHGWVMAADDPGWQQTSPIFGHNCRCRLIARSARWVEKNTPHIHTGPLPNLPDPGWTKSSAPPVPPIPPPASEEAKPPPPEKLEDPPLDPKPARGKSLLHKDDRHLPKRDRAALERLDGLDKDKRGRIKTTELGVRRARAAESAELAEAKAALDFEAMFSDGLPQGLTPVRDAIARVEDIIVHTDEIDGRRTAQLIREGSETPTVVQWKGRLHGVGDMEALAAAIQKAEKGRVRVRASVYQSDQRLLKEEVTPFKTRQEARLTITKSVTTGAGDVRKVVRRTLAGEGIVSRDATTVRAGRNKLAIRANLGGGKRGVVLGSHHPVTGEMRVQRENWERSQAAWAKIGRGQWSELSRDEAMSATTIIHEEIHGASTMGVHARTPASLAFEEATTELLSRRTLRRLVGIDAKQAEALVDHLPNTDEYLPQWRGIAFRHPWARPPLDESTVKAIQPYDHPIQQLLRTCEDYGFGGDQVESAAEKLRGNKYRGKWANTDREMMESFVRELPWGRAKTVKVRVGGEWTTMKAVDARDEFATDLMFALRNTLKLARALSVAALARNDHDGAVDVFREAKKRGRLDVALAKALLLLQDDPTELFDLILEELGDYSLDPVRA